MSEFFNNYQTTIYPVLIFSLKVPEICINTLRIILIAKGFKLYASVLTFIEASLWLTVLTLVFTKLDNPASIVAYAMGMAVGIYLGIVLEKKIALGVVLIRVITQLSAKELLKNLRKLGFRVTEVFGESNYGKVGILFAVVKRNNIRDFIEIVTRFNPKAFYTIEEINHVSQAILKGGGRGSSDHKLKDIGIFNFKL